MNKLKNPIFWAQFAGYAIPAIFLVYVLYINFLPFGYRKTFILTVGAPDDTKVDEWYLEPSQALGERKTAPDGTSYRELNGMATAVFRPPVVLRDATITVEAVGGGPTIIPPVITIDPDMAWDYVWDFTKGIPDGLTNSKAFYFDGATYFDGTARVELPGSADLFEQAAFSVYAEWLPMSSEGDGQQIVGHYNWELWQNKNSVSFQVGRMNNATGTMYRVTYPITPEFFNQKHTALAVYDPSTQGGQGQGSITLYVNGKFAGRVGIGSDVIWKNYGKNNLTFGWTPHNYENYPHLKGALYQVSIVNKNIVQDKSTIEFVVNSNSELRFPIISSNPTNVNELKLHVVQK